MQFIIKYKVHFVVINRSLDNIIIKTNMENDFTILLGQNSSDRDVICDDL